MPNNVRDLEVTVYATRKPEPTRRVAPSRGETNMTSSDNDGKIKIVSATIGSGLVLLRASAEMLGYIEISKQTAQAIH
jgi:hypothetical protein